MKLILKFIIVLVVLFSVEAHAEVRKFSRNYQECVSSVENINAKASCVTQEIIVQKKRLNLAYGKLSTSLMAEDRKVLDKVQRDWITWRDGNYAFLSEHVAGEYVTTRSTSLDFLLNSIYDRADELDMVLTEIGR